MNEDLARQVRKLRDTLRAGKELSAQGAETLADPEGAQLLATLQTELELAIEAGRTDHAKVLAQHLDTILAAEQKFRSARVRSAEARRVALEALNRATGEAEAD